MNTIETLEKRKSIRGYTSQEVEDQKLKTILKYGNKAPNAGEFHMSVITNKKLLKKINDNTLESMKNSDNEFMKQRAAIPEYEPLYGAPILILLSAPKEGFGAINTACAITNMTIAATELELGSCYVVSPLAAFESIPELSEKLEIPEGHIPQGGILLGYESEKQIPGKPWVEDYSNVNYIE
ncbi:MAG: nitroreductase family protein [Methanobacteriaceae archaeon]|nr:nitroreductase family protein [Methanobacteriaceae archaeon]